MHTGRERINIIEEQAQDMHDERHRRQGRKGVWAMERCKRRVNRRGHLLMGRLVVLLLLLLLLELTVGHAPAVQRMAREDLCGRSGRQGHAVQHGLLLLGSVGNGRARAGVHKGREEASRQLTIMSVDVAPNDARRGFGVNHARLAVSSDDRCASGRRRRGTTSPAAGGLDASGTVDIGGGSVGCVSRTR